MDRFTTEFPMSCNSRDWGGYRTDQCRKIGQPDHSQFTYAGYHADKSPRRRGVVDMYLPIAESGNNWYGPCDEKIKSYYDYCSPAF